MSEARADIFDEGYIYIYIYINCNLNPLTKFNSSSIITKLKDILPWSVSQMIMNIILMNTRIVISCTMKQGIPFWFWWEVSGNWDNNLIRISQRRESHCRRNTRRNWNTRVTVRDSSRKVYCLSKAIWDRKIIAEFTRPISFARVC